MATFKSLDNLDQYTVGWIAALPIERAAATAMLDELHKKPLNFTQPSNDKNSYTWGRIAEHNVVIASLPAGVYGTTSAAATAMSMLSSFPQIRIGLMVGIGAGISRPDEDLDIRLGDIAVSQPSGASGGVVQYDFGKAKTGDQFERIGFLNSPPQALLNALASLQAQAEIDGSRVPKILEEMLKKHPELAKAKLRKPSYTYQGQEHDKLFKSTYIHTQGKNCDNCDPEQEVKRDEREVYSPEIHYGLIVSGNTLVKDASTRDLIVKELGDDCICFEMEAAGLMNNFPCLVIRGICDYADSHKNDRWQRYAAATAAAYAKEFLGVIQGEDVERTQRATDALKDIAKNVTDIRDIAHETKSGVDLLSRDGHQQKVHAWLSPSDPSTNYNKALQQRHQGSGQWFLQSPRYSAWKTERNSFLWLYGIPGCGKTILSSTIVENLETGGVSHKLLYFYFDFSDNQKQSLENAVHSLIIQLYGKNADTQRHLDSLYSSCESGKRRPTLESLCKVFQEMIQQVGEVWIVLDALDECRTRREYSNTGLLPWLECLLNSQQMNVHLLVTSRPEQDIQSVIEKWAHIQDIVPIQGDLVAEDIRGYVQKRVRHHEGLSRWQQRPKVQAEIEAALIEKANGMFRWVSCQLDALENCLDYPTLKTALGSLPKTLDETYARILKSIPEEHKHHTIRILQFLAFSERPLQINEAIDAIAVQTRSKPRFDPENRMPVPKEISRYCSSLVAVVSKKDGAHNDDNFYNNNDDKKMTGTQIQLAHFSVKEYLTSSRLEKHIAEELQETAARASIAEVCLAYLLELKQDLLAKEVRRQYHLAQYSARYWTGHALAAETCSEAIHILEKEFFSENFYKAGYRLYNPDRPWDNNNEKDQELLPALYYASLEGLVDSVKMLLDKGADVNAQGGTYGNALQAASSLGHEKIVQMLLDKGADVNAQGGRYGNTLQAASFGGHEKIVQMLLEKDADVNAQGGEYDNALYAASYLGFFRGPREDRSDAARQGCRR
ncbi:uncharacterized protein K452DRAFT_250214 [Aplosporella prunicola CBS 121167]|uniref:Nephrocystin 3-like N-terminal domain-containing protein n=1 Tax=Aplosporella prunicola CBS 121167 TaxID=1176127 RepID=A0A6A6BFD5_9PEZI|nr:uncharacterized protein K452DRAFT_250214 [Aplosporella prunicola CBS 121167]KAF2142278.1 hypothetical protein K452DRAFT_250214 [Aplosporella prunicola CBS 121167]